MYTYSCRGAGYSALCPEHLAQLTRSAGSLWKLQEACKGLRAALRRLQTAGHEDVQREAAAELHTAIVGQRLLIATARQCQPEAIIDLVTNFARHNLLFPGAATLTRHHAMLVRLCAEPPVCAEHSMCNSIAVILCLSIRQINSSAIHHQTQGVPCLCCSSEHVVPAGALSQPASG